MEMIEEKEENNENEPVSIVNGKVRKDNRHMYVGATTRRRRTKEKNPCWISNNMLRLCSRRLEKIACGFISRSTVLCMQM